MKCILSISYSVNLKGLHSSPFKPSRGLPQGDPLSHFLFLICSEGLSFIMRSTRVEKQLKGVKASRRGLVIYHLLFADDCILFDDASLRVVSSLKRILKEYEVNLGQCVNFSKSSVFFSFNVQIEIEWRFLRNYVCITPTTQRNI